MIAWLADVDEVGQCIEHLSIHTVDGNEELIEENWWNDTFWGVCRGVGKNHLGQILMKIRKEIK